MSLEDVPDISFSLFDRIRKLIPKNKDRPKTHRAKEIQEEYVNGEIYNGNFVNGKRHGKGKLLFSENEYYEGTFINDNLDCGKYIKKDENNNLLIFFEGKFKENKLNSSGHLFIKDCLEYTGKFLNDNYNESGTLKNLKNNKIILGHYENGKLEGKCNMKIIINNETAYIFEGGFKNGKKVGYIHEEFKENVEDSDINKEKVKLIQGNYENGLLKNGTKVYVNGDKYIGEFKNGEYSGQGEYILSNGVVKYKGGYLNGIYNGEGVLKDEKGHILYDGDFDNGIYDGFGKVYENDKLIYVGKLKSGSKNGIGKIVYDNGDIFEGNFIDNRREGTNCKYYWKKENQIFQGEFKNNTLYSGTLKRWGKEGFLYKGSFVNGEMKGHGIIINNQNGIKIESDFNDRLPNGITKKTFKNGNTIETNYINGEPEEFPIVIYKNGDRFIADKTEEEMKDKEEIMNTINAVSNNNFVLTGKGKYNFSNNDCYTGNYTNGEKNGFGILNYHNGDRYEGNFENGQKNGQGTYYWKNGNYYEGNFVNGFREGYGTLYMKDQKYTGYFKKGKKDGQGIREFNDGRKFKQMYNNDCKINEYIIYSDSKQPENK